MAEEYSICLDIGGTKVLGAIFDKNEKPIYRLKKKTRSGGDSSENVEQVIISIVKEMIESLCLDLARKGLVSSRLGVGLLLDGHTRGNYRADIHFVVDIQGKGNLATLFLPGAVETYRRKVPRDAQVKSVAVSFANVAEGEGETYSLFDDTDEITKQKNLRDSLLEIEKKYGKNAVLKGADFTAKATRRERNTFIGGHNGGDEDA